MISHDPDVFTQRQRSFKGLKDDMPQENNLKTRTRLLAPSISFNDKMFKINQMQNPPPSCQVRKSAVIRLSYKRKSCEMDEDNEFCKNTVRLLSNLFVYVTLTITQLE